MTKKILLLAFFGLITLIGYSSSQLSGVGGIGVAPVGKTFRYAVKTSTYAPVSVSLTGLGASWLFSVSGGTASFKLSNGQEITLIQEMTLGGELNYAITNPTISLTGLSAGATAFMYLDGAN